MTALRRPLRLAFAGLLLAAPLGCRTLPEPPPAAPPVISLDQAAALDAEGDYAAAEQAAAEALTLADRHADPDDPGFPLLLMFLARENMNRAHFEKAQRHLARARLLNDRHFRPADPRSSALTATEAELAMMLGQASEGETLARHQLELAKAAYGPRHPFVADELSLLARALEEQDRVAEAQPLWSEALAILKNAWGGKHRDVAWAIMNLAQNAAMSGRGAAAERLAAAATDLAAELARGATRDERALAETDRARLELARGSIELQLADDGAARKNLERALPLLRASLGPHHPDTGWARVLLGQALAGLGDFKAAEPHLAEGLETIRRSHGDQHPLFMNALMHRSAAYHRAGWDAEAVADYDEAQQILARLKQIGRREIGVSL
ncbi:Tetratricopeptide repeat-containing protein [Tistlia consotensis]|uniref:Tetratricopeptide repeat-containing protein n=1 Tax=Tistlia consotensis USBA 355 TaxID=560819 RepID=A0A1Y6BPL8_9PROT|nr:tetratricopeptide repeat protein [Tistlia consotensis]SMF13538.1 Tetratricopeptide repeat-containing protein [Tistlia consotensis USBA 355]SNR50407.1 Tetratricopeptide repeat-containing protein [Tistlia consotensis]